MTTHNNPPVRPLYFAIACLSLVNLIGILWFSTRFRTTPSDVFHRVEQASLELESRTEHLRIRQEEIMNELKDRGYWIREISTELQRLHPEKDWPTPTEN